jgi:hypothetical protein
MPKPNTSERSKRPSEESCGFTGRDDLWRYTDRTKEPSIDPDAERAANWLEGHGTQRRATETGTGTDGQTDRGTNQN